MPSSTEGRGLEPCARFQRDEASEAVERDPAPYRRDATAASRKLRSLHLPSITSIVSAKGWALMIGKLVKRIVRADQAMRLSVYQRPDGLFCYLEEQLSEWDDCPPAWVGDQVSGIFYSAAEAVIEARDFISWLGQPQKQSNPMIEKSMAERWRPIGTRERDVLMHLLRGEFPGRSEILRQMQSVEVMRIDPEGSLKLRSDGPLADVQNNDYPSERKNGRIPVEGFYMDDVDESGALVHLLLHVIDGKINELEIYKEDGGPILIDPYEIELSRIYFY